MRTIEPAKEELQSGPRIARILDVDPATLRRWRREGCPHHIIGEGLVRYRLEEVLQWRAQRPNMSKTQRDKKKEEGEL
jgi:phage terminase Nu1 subunit (DNA packaging protein)